jgi:hypothetical protein
MAYYSFEEIGGGSMVIGFILLILPLLYSIASNNFSRLLHYIHDAVP